MPSSTPMPIMPHGNDPPKIPLATEAIRVACGASRGSGCAALGTPMP
jgi:hypothetical protein